MRADDFRLPFLHTYRTMCFAPPPEFRRVLEGSTSCISLIRPQAVPALPADADVDLRTLQLKPAVPDPHVPVDQRLPVLKSGRR
jgi:hypothetical protein